MSWGGCQKRNGLPWLSARGVPLSLKVSRSHPWRMLRPAYDVDIGHSKSHESQQNPPNAGVLLR